MPTFEPPTYETFVATRNPPRFKLTQAQSVVRINGLLTLRKTPTHAQLKAAGAEGVDWFIGGHIYAISDATATELTTAGFQVTTDLGYGIGPYGSGSFGG